MKISENTIKIGHAAGYYNRFDAFRFRASILPEKYFDEDAPNRAKEIEKYSRYSLMVERALINNGLSTYQ